MKNSLTNTTNNNYDYSVAQTPADFRNMMNHFWNFMDLSSNEFFEVSPKIQVTETKEAINLKAELPGIDEKDVSLRVSADGYLSITGEKKNNTTNTKDNYFSEISYGSFKRTIQLPWDLDYDATTAQYNKGVLEVSIPKSQTEKQKFKSIDIKTA